MVRYRRNFLPAGTYFFTVTLSDRRSMALVDHVGELRDAFVQEKVLPQDWAGVAREGKADFGERPDP
jgi:hypothetical protein